MSCSVHTENTMENTLASFENDIEAKWYISQAGRLLGPISGKEVAHWITAKGLSVGNFIWNCHEKGWKRVYEIPEFQPLLPPEPSKEIQAEAAKRAAEAAKDESTIEAPVATPAGRVWYVFTNKAQYGPFAKTEVELMIESGRVDSNSYLWKKGMLNWEAAGTVREFTVPAGTDSKSDNNEQREAPRKPYEAKILMTDGQEVGWAICRDVSIGGMQVLMDHSPGQVGTVLKLNVSESDNVPAFTCEGTIVRVLEDGRGFSFRFDNLPDDARQAIEQYVSMS